MSNIISENFSKIRRGRPRKFNLATLRQVFPEYNTERSFQNCAYMLRAHQLLNEHVGKYPQLAWLYTERPYRKTLLSELGRIDNDKALITWARAICKEKPKSYKAVAWIRLWRLTA